MRGSTVYRHLWGTEEVYELFDDGARLEAWMGILAALAQAQADLGLVPAVAADEIKAASHVDRLDLDYVAAETRATQHSTLGLIRAMQRVLSPEAGEWYCFGATVQDVSDTWTAQVMVKMAGIVERDLAAIEAALLALAAEHRDLAMPGRTHGQTGLPITLGFKVAVWAAEVRRHRDRLAEAAPRFSVGQLGGAAGTGSFWGASAPALLEGFCAQLGLGAPEMPWVSARDRLAEFAVICALAVHTMAKVGNEILELSRPEVGELAEPFTPGAVGSITMPHKRNPERSEHLVTLARLARASLGVLVEATIVEHERDGRAWKSEWVAFPDLCLSTGAALAIARTLVEGLGADGAAMTRNLVGEGGYVFSERVMVALAEKVGKQSAHLMVYEASMAGRETGLSFREALEAHAGITAQLSSADLDRLLDPAASSPAPGAYVDRVLDQARRREKEGR